MDDNTYKAVRKAFNIIFILLGVILIIVIVIARKLGVLF